MLHYAGFLVVLVCAATGYSIVHVPTMEDIAAKEARIDQLRLSIENGPIIRRQHRAVSAKLDQVTQRIEDVKRRVPQEAHAGEFLKELMKVASAEQLSIKDFTPETPQDRDGFTEMRVSFKGAGSYASICRFIDQLSKMTRLSKVNDLTVSAEGSGDEYPMTATLVIYFDLRGNEATVSRSPGEEGRG